MKPMHCDEIESCLPNYADGDLTPEEMAAVDRHANSCDKCRESLESYLALESLLVRRKTLRPPANKTTRRVMRRLGTSGRRAWLGELVGLPGVVSLSLIVFGILLLLTGVSVPEAFFKFDGSSLIKLTAGLEQLASDVLLQTEDDQWLILSIYMGALASLFAIGSWMVVRFVRN